MTPTSSLLRCGARQLDLSTPVVMGILNATPDSFSDGGQLLKGGSINLEAAMERARGMVAAGAQILDIGGESTRPGAEPVSEEEELRRVIPLVEAIQAELSVVVSVDTSSPQVMREAARAGAGLINDVRSLRREGALDAALATGLPVCIMHMPAEPGVMQQRPGYDRPVIEVVETYLRQRVAELEAAGFARDRLILDPGFGFGKTARHNLQLLQQLSRLTGLGLPILVGLSRKSVFGAVLGRAVPERLAGSLSAALLAAQAGASILRVHDVAETADVLNFWAAVQTASERDDKTGGV